MDKAADLFNEAFLRAMEQFGTVSTFKSVFERGLPTAKGLVDREHWALVHRFVTDPEYAGVLNKEAIKAAGMSWAHDMVERMTEMATRTAKDSANAASLVFAHAALDAWLLDLCRVTVIKAPRDWEASVKDKQISLSSVRGTTYEQLLEQALSRFFEQLDRESLPSKINLLFQRCRPEPDWFGENYKYDGGRIMKLDKLRHEIVHGDALRRGIPDLGADLFYLQQTGMQLMGIVSFRYGIQLDPSYVERRSRGGAPPTAVSGGEDSSKPPGNADGCGGTSI